MNKKLYIATWPNGTITIFTAKNNMQASLILDSEGDPEKAVVHEINFKENIHIRTDVIDNAIEWQRGDYAIDAVIKDYIL